MSMTRESSRRGVDAVEVVGAVLQAILHENGSGRLKDIAERSGISRPKVHRYLVSMIACGLVERDEDGVRYRFGLLARGIGMRAASEGDFVSAVVPAVTEFAETHGLTCGIAQFALGEVRVQRWIIPTQDFAIAPRPGGAIKMEIASSVTGRLIGAYLPDSVTRPLIAAELEARGASDIEAEIARVRRDYAEIRSVGMVCDAGPRVKGVNALSVPVLGREREVLLGLTLIGHESMLPARHDTQIAGKLLALSRRLGQLLGGIDPEAPRQADESREIDPR